jgi:hypothetical protein
MNAALKYDILETYQYEIYQDDMTMVEPLCTLSVYDLGSIDHCVSLSRNKKFGFTLEVTNEEDQLIYTENELHPYALESMASFCRRFLHCYENVMENNNVYA